MHARKLTSRLRDSQQTLARVPKTEVNILSTIPIFRNRLDDIKEAKASAIDMVEKDDGEFEQDDALTKKRTSLLMMQVGLRVEG